MYGPVLTWSTGSILINIFHIFEPIKYNHSHFDTLIFQIESGSK